MSKNNTRTDFDNVDDVDQKVRDAVRQALARHKEMKNPLPTWDGNGVKIVAPEDLPEHKKD
ncbi:MAG: hypothetical protein J0L72_02135 [Armatimonadetes bacterium]|nr:hypothetical protein [Armatimonadota bacterium]